MKDETKSVPKQPLLPKTGKHPAPDASAKEVGGVGGPEPTRYGDWERKGKCVDF